MNRSFSRRVLPNRLQFLLGLTLIAGVSRSAGADPVVVTFSTGGTNYSANAITETPAGNILAVGGQSALAGLTQVGQTSNPFTVLFQSQIQFDDANTGQAVNPQPAGFFTVTGSFMETATLTGASSVALNLASGSTSFNIYYNNPAVSGVGGPNSATGTGFQNGSLIYSGTIGASSGTFGVTQPVTSNGNGTVSGTVAFDPNHSSTDSRQAQAGTGLTNLTINETSYNNNFFTSNLMGTSLSFQISTNTAFVTAGASPSAAFFDGTTTHLPTINGTLVGNSNAPGPNGYDIQFQSNGSGSFAVPEPASVGMTLLGLGGLGFGAFRSSRRKQSVA